MASSSSSDNFRQKDTIIWTVDFDITIIMESVLAMQTTLWKLDLNMF